MARIPGDYSGCMDGGRQLCLVIDACPIRAGVLAASAALLGGRHVGSAVRWRVSLPAGTDAHAPGMGRTLMATSPRRPCWAHVQRNFHDVHVAAGQSPTAGGGLTRYLDD